MIIYESIIECLNREFIVEHLFLENESSMHNVPPDSESHFKLVIVSENFNDMSKVQRHQAVYSALNNVMNKIHALSIQAFNEKEFKSDPIILDSPECANK